MIVQPRICPYCGEVFLPSSFRPDQKICSAATCQRRRQADYHRTKCESDAEYCQVCLESRTKWRGTHPGYQHTYRQDHPDYVDQNRRLQKRRDRKRRMSDLVKNNLAFDLKSSSADVWLAGPELEDLVKNNLAISQVMLFQTVSSAEVRAG